MMAWIPILLFVAVVLVAMVWLFKLPRGAWEAVAAALMLGLAGYAVQSSPGQAGAPGQRNAAGGFDGAALIEVRRQFDGSPVSKNSTIVTADGLVRSGRFDYAAALLNGYLDKNPDDSEAWTALGNAILAQAEGNLTEAAIEAYRRGAVADEADPAPYFFLGLGWLNSGDFERTAALWQLAYERTEEGTPAHEEMGARLSLLAAMIARAEQMRELSPSETQ